MRRSRRARRTALILGLGLFGRALARRLTDLGWEVVGADAEAAAVQEMRDRLAMVVQLDAREEEALATLDVPEFEVCVVTTGSDVSASVLIVLNLQQAGARAVVAKASSEAHARLLRRLGVDQIVFPERDAGVRLAESLQSPHLVQWIDLARERELGVLQVPGERDGTGLEEWRALRQAGLQVVARLDREGRPLPAGGEVLLRQGETLLVVGPLGAILALGK